MFNSVKNGWGFTFIVVIIVFLLAACGGSDSASSENQERNDNQVENDEDQEENNSEEQETYKLSMSVTFPPVADEMEPKNSATDKFAKLVEERTNGQVEVDVFFSNQLVPADQALDAMANGTIDIAAAGSYWAETIPTQDFAWLPFAFYGTDHMRHVLRETEIGEIYEKNLEEHGVKVLMYWPTGNEGIISKEPVTKLEDMKGKTFRLGSGLWANWYSEIGAAPANIAGGEQYEALMRGTIDGAMYPFYTLDTHNLHEVADHITVPGIIDPILCANYISLDSWNELPEELQQIIDEVAMEMEAEAMENSVKVDEVALDIAQENGVTVNQLTRDEFQRFIDSAQGVWDEFAAKSEDTARIVELLRENQEEYLENNPDAQEWRDKWLAD